MLYRIHGCRMSRSEADLIDRDWLTDIGWLGLVG